jgi:hypothetical protein
MFVKLSKWTGFAVDSDSLQRQYLPTAIKNASQHSAQTTLHYHPMSLVKPAPHLTLFLQAVHGVHASGAGTKETSYYTALNNLLDGVGAALSPTVHAVMQLKNTGAGNPDGGLFTADQFDKKTGETKDLSFPARGVIEVKAPAEAIDTTLAGEQIAKYWARYKLVLMTNLRDWALIGERNGQRVTLERFSLAPDEAAFWALAAKPNAAQADTKTLGAAFADFLARVLQHNAPLADPKDLAFLLASYAREAKYRVALATDTSPAAAEQLSSLKASLETALGVSFNAIDGEQFFRSTLVQTLFYGVFSAWVLEHETQPSASSSVGAFNWRSAAHSLNVPMIAALFGQLSQPAKLKALNLTEVLDWATDALNRVDKAAFFASFETTRSIQYFYEPFLAQFDPVLRKSLGVWYTPEEVVRYQVARVDQVLQSELGIAAGLADERVVVLDPCCGTGAYLVETLRLIARKLTAQGASATLAHELKQAATQRLFGFELLPAPYVVAHLQIGLLLRQLGAPLSDEERAGVYLTNALTGWEPPKAPKSSHLPFPEFEQERDAADKVKREQKIIVILGNPPYDAFGGVAQGEEQDLVAPYKEGLIKTWGIKKFNLDDLYVRFFRLAERRIAEQGGQVAQGVVSFISNYSWSTEPSFVVLRQRLLKSFDKFWLENMHGNRNISEYAPDGRSSETVFAQKGFSAGIRQGIVISTWVKTGKPNVTKQVLYCDDFSHARATDRRQALLDSLTTPQRDTLYQAANPSASNKFSFKPSDVSAAYESWPLLSEFSPDAAFNGLFEKRGSALVDVDKVVLLKTVKRYFDEKTTWEMLVLESHPLSIDSARFEAKLARQRLLSSHVFSEANIVRYCVRPFDVRYCYRTIDRPLWSEPRPRYQRQLWQGNKFLVSRPNGAANPEGFPMSYITITGDHDWIRGHSYHFAFETIEASDDLLGTQSSTRANLSALARNYLAALKLPDPDTDKPTAELLWLHALAIGYSPAYLAANADGIRQGWPRIPLPATAAALQASAALGAQVAALLDTETPVAGVTTPDATGQLNRDLSTIAVLTRKGGGALQPAEFALTAGWGSKGAGGITMPGKGKLETVNVDGKASLDIYLNPTAYWHNVPPAVWGFTIGGYPVMKKWLSYRERSVLGRDLTLAELKEVSHMARRLAALVALQAQLDENYEGCAGDIYGANT